MKWLDRSLFDSPIQYALCLNREDFKKFFNSDKYFPKTGANIILASKNDNLHAVITLADDYKDLDTYEVHAMLTHEAMHLVDYIMEEICEDNPSKEFKAYMIQNICLELFATYKKMTKGQK